MPAPIYLSIVEFTGDGVTTEWDFSFAGGYLRQEHVKVITVDLEEAYTEITLTPADFITASRLRITPAVPLGHKLRISRETPKEEPLVNFTGGSNFTEANLDVLAKQAIFVAAEAYDAGGYAGANDLIAAASQAQASATAAAGSAAAASAATAEVIASASAAVAALNEAAGLANEANRKNLLHNPSRSAIARPVPSGPVAANTFVVDRWKTGGAITSLAIGGHTTTITIGSITQLVRDIAGPAAPAGTPVFTATDKFILAWGGTARARINGGAWQTSPHVFTVGADGSEFTVEFGLAADGSPSTLYSTRCYWGEVDYGYKAPIFTDVEEACARYYQRIPVLVQYNATASGQVFIWTVYHPLIGSSVVPTSETVTNTNVSSVNISVLSRRSLAIDMTAAASGAVRATRTIVLDTGV